MKLTKLQRLQLLQSIIAKLQELRADGGASWRASLGISMLQGWLDAEIARLSAELPPAPK